MENEEWRDIAGFEGVYQVSNLGRVKRIKAERRTRGGYILKNIRQKIGYSSVNLSRSGKSAMYYIHRLVAEAFMPNPENKPEIDHIDGSRDNNKVDNLRWCTRKENQNFPIAKKRHGIATTKTLTGRNGISSNSAKAIICIETGVLYWGALEANRVTGISHGCISAVVRGEWKTAGGYHWRLATDREISVAKTLY